VRADEPVPPAPLWSALTSRHPTTPTGPNGGSAARPVTSRSWPAPPSVAPAPGDAAHPPDTRPSSPLCPHSSPCRPQTAAARPRAVSPAACGARRCRQPSP
jgi:hypothetical protein